MNRVGSNLRVPILLLLRLKNSDSMGELFAREVNRGRA